MIDFPGMLLVSGTGRDSCKTTFVCTLIEKFKEKHAITAIKIAPHAHRLSPDDDILEKHEDYPLVRETNVDTGKDSSQMLRAGAKEVFYVQVIDEYIPIAFEKLLPYISDGNILICESGGLRNHLQPDLFLIIHNVDNDKIKSSAKKLVPLADRYIERNGDRWNFQLEKIKIENNRWLIG